MKIGIIGAGNLGIAIGARLAEAGHHVSISFARTPEALAAAAARVGHGAVAATVREAVLHGDVVVLATPWTVTLETVRELADSLAGKVLWDTTNALLPDMSGLALGTTTSGGEAIAAAAPAARVVKAIAPFADVLAAASSRIEGQQPAVFVCGDDAEARAIVARLVGDLDALAVDAGPLRLARFTEPAGLLLAQLAYAQGFGSRIALNLLRDSGGG